MSERQSEMRQSGWRRLFESNDLGSMAPAQKLFTYALLALWTFVVLFPLYWMAITSLKLPIQVDDGPDYLPFIDFEPSLHAWRYIFFDLGNDTLRPYLNSLIIASVSTLIAVLIGAMAAYALVRIRFEVKLATVGAFLAMLALTVAAVAIGGVPWPIAIAAALALFILFVTGFNRRFKRALGNSDIQFWFISNRILPPVVVVLPIYIMFQRVGLLDTHVAMIATYVAVNLPIVVWLMRDFFAGVPIDLEESAEIDGASRQRIFWTIVLPLTKPGLVATSLLVFILAWNEYLLALFLSTARAQTMPLLIAAQNATRGPQWWYMSVLILIMIAPVVILTILLQKQIARGLLVGAVKG
ncbi:MAG TPA: carbohydrate ABC transporter permease [Hyphomicrobiales bacterium]|nr:carbohydrate ABC transporter permease [Hyphomicrobiales bacterium]